MYGNLICQARETIGSIKPTYPSTMPSQHDEADIPTSALSSRRDLATLQKKLYTESSLSNEIQAIRVAYPSMLVDMVGVCQGCIVVHMGQAPGEHSCVLSTTLLMDDQLSELRVRLKITFPPRYPREAPVFEFLEPETMPTLFRRKMLHVCFLGSVCLCLTYHPGSIHHRTGLYPKWTAMLGAVRSVYLWRPEQCKAVGV